MYKEDLVFNNLEMLICHKTKLNHYQARMCTRIEIRAGLFQKMLGPIPHSGTKL